MADTEAGAHGVVAPRRDQAVDQLKMALVAAVIVTHCAITYSTNGSWFYRDPSGLGWLANVLDVPIAFGALFAMGTFFYIAGCFASESLARKGARRYLNDRLLRLGLPVALTIAVMVPVIEIVVAAVTTGRTDVAGIFRTQLSELDAGPLWFAAALLIFSGALAALPRRPPESTRVLTPRIAASWAAGIAVTSFVLRLRFAIDTFQIGSLHLWQWGQCVGLFALGASLGVRGVEPVGRRLRHGCYWTTVIGALCVISMLAAFHDDLTPLGGGWHWQAALVAILEGALCVSATVVLLDLAQRRWGRTILSARRIRLSRAAFGAYVVQAPVIVAVALVLRTAPLPGVVKFVVTAAISLAACFGLAANANLLRVSSFRIGQNVGTHRGEETRSHRAQDTRA